MIQAPLGTFDHSFELKFENNVQKDSARQHLLGNIFHGLFQSGMSWDKFQERISAKQYNWCGFAEVPKKLS